MSVAPARIWFQSLAVAKSLALALAWRGAILIMALLLAAPGTRAEGIELTSLSLTRNDEGLFLEYSTRFDLPAAVEDALLKGVPIYFVAEAEVFRSRWYWRDQRVARSIRNWRLTWQPLTRRYLVNLGSVSQSYDSVSDALGAVQRASRWKLADPAALGSEAGLYVEFSLRLDTSQLPRPLQISFGGQSDWELRLERTVKLPDAVN